jgi:large subunit ribosomal protein L35
VKYPFSLVCAKIKSNKLNLAKEFSVLKIRYMKLKAKKNIKAKTKGSVKKRFTKSKGGFLKHSHAHTSHNFNNKTAKQKRHSRKSSFLNKCDFKRLRKMNLNNSSL